MDNLYEKIKELCKAEGISVAGLARKCNLSPSIFTELKSGRSKSLSAKTAMIIAEYFGVNPMLFLDDELEPTPEMLEDIRTDAEKRILFQLLDGATVEDVRKVIGIVKVLKGETDE